MEHAEVDNLVVERLSKEYGGKVSVSAKSRTPSGQMGEE